VARFYGGNVELVQRLERGIRRRLVAWLVLVFDLRIDLACDHRAAILVLHHVGELMGEQRQPCLAVRLVAAASEEDVVTGGEGERAQMPAQLVGA
jgi:hypothetical protein